jgi:biopolymer transport protein ExbB/TolQ
VMLSGVVSFLAKGGPVMIPLAICSVLALAVVIERGIAWLRLGSLADPDGVLARVASGKWEDALDRGLRTTVEAEMIRYRGLLRDGAPLPHVEGQAAKIEGLLGQARDLLDAGSPCLRAPRSCPPSSSWCARDWRPS